MSQISTSQISPSPLLDSQPPTAIPPRTSSAAQQESSHKRSKSASSKPSSSSKPSDFFKFARRSLHSPHKTSPLRRHQEPPIMDESSTNKAMGSTNGEPTKQKDKERRKSFGQTLIYQKEATWSETKDRLIMGPYDYLYGHPGKDIRAQLIDSFNVWLKVPEPSLKIITEVVGMLHTASLLIDDVEDSSKLRRGVPVAHSIFGTAQTINSANYVYFLALQEIQKLSNPQAIAIFTEELINLHRGQGMDLFWRDSLTCPSEEDYLEMVSNKTGGLFRLAIKLMQAESSSSRNCTPLVNAISLLFQILDDYQNLSSQKYTANKGLAEDLTEGKFSFPVIHAIRTDPDSKVLLNILKQKTTDEEVKKYAVKYMDAVGSLAYTRQVLRDLTRRSIALIDELESGEPGSGSGLRSILEKLRVESPRSSAGAGTGAVNGTVENGNNVQAAASTSANGNGNGNGAVDGA